MQDFPLAGVDTSQESTSWYDSGSNASTTGFSFDDYLNAQLDAAAQEYEQSLNWFSGTSSDASNGLSDTAYDAGLGNDPMLSLTVTTEDFAALEEELNQAGLSQETIDEIRTEVEQGSLNWKQLLDRIDQELRAASGQSGGNELSAEDERDLISFFGKLGFTPQESDRLLSQLKNGDTESALSAISAKISRMGDGQVVSVNKNELIALAKAMGLDQNAQIKVASLFGDMSNVDLSKDQLASAVGLLRREDLMARHGLLRENIDLARTLTSIMDVARGRADIEALADNKATRDAEASEALIKDEAQATFGKNRAHSNSQDVIGDKRTRPDTNESGWAKRARTNQENADSAQAQGENTKAGRGAETVSKETAQDAAREAVDKAEENALLSQANKRYQAGRESFQPDAQAKDTGQDAQRDSAWAELARRIRVDNSAQPTAAMASAAATSAKAAEAAAESAMQVESDSQLSQRLLRTVQDGVMRTLQQNTKQLTLRLDPPSLGKVTVILQVHNKEVNAVIRTENEDVSRIVGDQLAQIRQSLEEQGLKVQELDVQTEISQEQQPHWLGAEQHNLARGSEESELLTAWKRLMGSGREPVEQAAAETIDTARPLHEQGLHIVA
ncbi:MAG: flagellar hook-length control protein FliK [Desulfovibrio sp.]|nr:MAG: flagellar hook-length control protein FliK [Desulfovibrio sp.]